MSGGDPAGTATAAMKRPAWYMHEDCAADVQSLLACGLKGLPCAEALLLGLSEGPRGAWIAALLDAGAITAASAPAEGQTTAGAVALTAEGLRRSGLDAGLLGGFSAAFREGMTEPSRARRLGDAPGTVCPDGLRWSGRSLTEKDGAEPGVPQSAAIEARDAVVVHAVLLLYAVDETALASLAARLRDAIGRRGATVLLRIGLTDLPNDPQEPMREHFGFVDGVSQPIPQDHPEDAHRAFKPLIDERRTQAAMDAALDRHRVWAGDILFGRRDAYGERPAGPFVPEENTAADRLPTGIAPSGNRDFAWNGSYLVLRQLRQDAPAFWDACAAVAARHGFTARHVAEKIVGRTLDGALLTPDGIAATDNEAGFDATDPDGFGCPRGSHVRRANPRDAGARTPAERKGRLDSVNAHRILRRGRNYGPAWSPDGPDAERGLLFACFNTDIVRQFEFVQQTWLVNRNFAASGEADPLVGPKGKFSIEGAPVRRRIDVETFVRLVGGEYFFLPSLAALRYLAAQAANP